MDEKELTAAMHEHKSYLLHVAFSVLKNKADAEEAYAQAWLNAWKNIHSYNKSSAVRTWLHTITRNVAIDIIRRRKESSGDIDAVETGKETPSPSANMLGNCFREGNPEQTLSERQFVETLETCLEALKPNHREVLLLRGNGLTYKEIANTVGVPKGTVMSRIHHGRRHLAELLGVFGYEISTEEKEELEDEEYMGTMTAREQRVAIYAQIWEGAEPQPDGTRVRYHERPVEVVHTAARAAGIDLSKNDAQKEMGKIEWLGLDWKGGYGKGCKMTCKVDPTTLLNGGQPAKSPSKPPPHTEARPITLAPTAYRFLYRERGKRDEHGGIYVADPLRELRGKWPNRDAQGTLDALVAHAELVEWREIPIPNSEEKARRLYFLVDPMTVRDSDEGMLTTADAPPKPTVEAAPTVCPPAQTPIVAPPSTSAQPDPPPPVRTEESESERRIHGLIGVYMTPLEKKIWDNFVRNQPAQPRGGWTMNGISVTAQTMAKSASANMDDTQLTVGRFCAAGLMARTEGSMYKLAWNPADVMIREIAKRRIVLTTEDRAKQLASARTIALQIKKANGGVGGQEFAKKVAAAWGGLTTTAITNTLLDYGNMAEEGSGVSLGVLYRLDEGGSTLLLAPESLAGCDFFENPDKNRARSMLVKPTDKDLELYHKYTSELRQRYHAIANGEKASTPVVIAPAAPPPPPPAPTPVAPLQAPPQPAPPAPPSNAPAAQAVEVIEPHTPVAPIPVEAPPPNPPTDSETAGSKLERLENEKVTLIERESAARKEAEELLRRAAELQASADEAQRRRKAVEQDIADTKEAMASLAALNLDMAKLLANREEILRRLRS